MTAHVIARHFDRTEPALEESAELVLAPADELPLAARLEQRRVASALSALPSLPRLPDRHAFRLGVAGIAAAALGTVLLLAPRPPASWSMNPTGSPATGGSAAPLSIGSATITITPPSYTGLPARRQGDWEIDAPEGSLVTWRIAASADEGRLMTSAGDTVPLAQGDGAFTAALRARQSLLYQARVSRGDARLLGDFHRLTVHPDDPPVVTILRPDAHREIPAGGPMRVDVDVGAADDYGVAGARLLATLTSGEGEAVKFREQVIPLVRTGPRPGPHGALYHAVLDLAALGLRPGDEIYFHAEAVDGRTPAPNVSRSETVFLTLLDSARVPLATIPGVTIRLTPEFFRSERQIIIDTEKLLADRARLSADTFRTRSNDIGIDQALLRTRYGTLVGDETESEEGSPEAHQHDTPENATLLAASVKDKLRKALAEMWEAEIRLRTYRPAEALPYEHRALDWLKQAQQSARVYVQKVGFQPPPLDPARTRLTGKLDAIHSRTDRDSVPERTVRPAIRAALSALSGTGDVAPLNDAVLLSLERAESELAPLAAIDAGALTTLRRVRALVDHARRGERCEGCRAQVVRGLWQALPDSATDAPARARARVSPLARRYLERLEGTP